MRRLALTSLALAGLLASAAPALAVQPDEISSDPALEARARALSAGLRCLVCQNQSIDDSDAPLARDLRILVRDRLKAGDSDGAVTAFVVARYGDYVLLRPPFKPATLLLWLAPFLALGAGALALWLKARRSPAAAGEAELNADEEAELQALIEREPR